MKHTMFRQYYKDYEDSFYIYMKSEKLCQNMYLAFSDFRLSNPIVSNFVTLEATPTTRYNPWSS
jgi:hypothetical protein